METNQQRNADTATARPVAVETLACPNCHARFMHGMRFCRACGYRLGEGVAEYVATMRFDGSTVPAAFSPAPQPTTYAPAQPTTTLAPARRRAGFACGGWRMNWLMWPLLLVLFTSAAGGTWLRNRPFWREKLRQNIFTMLGLTKNINIPPTPRSFFGTRGFVNTEGGVMVDAVIPNSPAERAGLVGGDIIASFDGKHPQNEGDMTRLLRSTPIGKAVEIVFLRDNMPKVTTLTTASSTDFNSDGDALMNPGGGPQGFLGVNDYERVQVPGSHLYGVRLDDVITNRPADLAGLHEGDIVVEFNGTPIRTTHEFEARIHRATPGQTVDVTVIRDGQQQVIPVKMGRR
jgi:membrane-associated protease RseP (regulator of RpoE activity)